MHQVAAAVSHSEALTSEGGLPPCPTARPSAAGRNQSLSVMHRVTQESIRRRPYSGTAPAHHKARPAWLTDSPAQPRVAWPARLALGYPHPLRLIPSPASRVPHHVIAPARVPPAPASLSLVALRRCSGGCAAAAARRSGSRCPRLW